MVGNSTHPGPVPLVVAAMREAGMGDFSFERNPGFRHDPLLGWLFGSLWRGLEAIAPPDFDGEALSRPAEIAMSQ